MYRKTVDELEEDKRQKLIIDIRRGEDYERETYPDAVNIFWEVHMYDQGRIALRRKSQKGIRHRRSGAADRFL